ncbi:hypothetical protein ACRQ5Q_11310 [Bradyrhizobium sp. PMVTL-01]|uniref:hypothetical protein n=1 Tax=Bradyrhizobium sp. PMVTL-01 TaxID=3434999 RepID=UPI003F72067C
MRWLHGDVLSGSRVDPSAEDPTARKHNPVNRITLDHGNLQILIEWRHRFEPLPDQIAIRSWSVFIAAG